MGKFGRLVIVARNVEKGRSFCLAKCDCGKEKIVRYYEVLNGRIQSCGCLQKEVSRANGKLPKDHLVTDISGRRFGRLVAVERQGSTKHGTSMWLCRCDCGSEKVISRNHLVTGNAASCGCAAKDGSVVRSAEKRAKSLAYVNHRIATDKKYLLSRRMQHLVYESLRSRNAKKSDRWESLVGYPIADLHRRLKRTVPAGYTWGDFMSGALHIDHIVPLAVHNYQSAEDQDFKRAWALSNLQLLPAQENISKSAKLSAPFQPSFSFGDTQEA